MLPIPDVTDVDMAFGKIRGLLPAWDALPAEYRRESASGCRVASGLFYKGGKLSDHGLKPRDGVDSAKATRVLRACLGSFQPKHEHKIAGVGYLIDQWFEPSAAP
jgi:hypothetical protein